MTAWEEAQRAYAAGRGAEALEACRRVLSAEPGHVDALHLAGVAAQALGDAGGAAAYLARAVELAPGEAVLHLHLGRTLLRLGRRQEAEGHLETAARQDPGDPEAPLHLGILRRDAGRPAEAEACFRRALALAPGWPVALGFLGNLLAATGRPGEALPLLAAASEASPASPEPHHNLAKALDAAGRLSEAMDRYARALALRPDFVEARTNLSVLQAGTGLVAEGLAGFREALAQAPDRWPTRSAYLYHLHHDPDLDPGALLAEHRRWSSAAPPGPPAPSPPGAVLRVGFSSPDFRRHSCAYFLEPLLANLDPARVEVFAYADLAARDEVTERIAARCARFLDTTALDDEALAARIREDRLDILVDLAGHTADNRLPVFARRAAPVQATWLGYPGTTGVEAMDFRFTDAVADPPGAEAHHSERLLRLPVFLCYGGDPAAPLPAAPPSAGRGTVTYGSFNNLPKLNDRTLRLWARVLAATPGSRLLLKGHRAFDDAGVRARTLARLEAAGIDPAAVELARLDPGYEAHLARYAGVDVALDPFPYHGTTTTCEALWMGVPVVVLEGDRHASRVGCSLLRAAGFPEWIAGDEDAYVALAARLAADEDGRVRLRRELRAAVAASPLCDGAAFARAFEAALRSAAAGGPSWT
jgi:predicted O-linked N-acetylglucosamine transferase (SPINDLY family)